MSTARKVAKSPAPLPATTRQRIIDIALEAFATLGFDGATTRDIAQRADVNQGLITYHFASKDGLWKAAVDQIFGELTASFGQRADALDDADPETRARLLMRHFVRFAATNPQLHRLMVQEGKSDGPRLKWLVDRHVRPMYEMSRSMMQEAGPLAALRIDPVHLYYIFIGAAAHIFVMAPECRQLSGVDPTQAQFVKAHADAVIDLLFPIAKPPAPARARAKQRRPAAKTSKRKTP